MYVSKIHEVQNKWCLMTRPLLKIGDYPLVPMLISTMSISTLMLKNMLCESQVNKCGFAEKRFSLLNLFYGGVLARILYLAQPNK